MSRVVLAVDGNSLVHRGYHALAANGFRTARGEPVWAVRGLLMQLVDAVERVGPSHVVVGFDDAGRSRRRERWPAYKAQRPDKLPTLVSQLELAAQTLGTMGVQVEVPAGLEADDVLASVAARTREAGGRTVLLTSDRDAFALIDEHTAVLRLIDGGVDASPLLTPDRLELMLGISPHRYREFAALRGDPSDNLPGVRGIGPKTAARLVAAYPDVEQAFDDAGTGTERLRELVGPACAARLAEPDVRADWHLTRELMTMHDDLPMSAHAPLPLDPTTVERAYQRCRLPGTRPRALRALCDVEPTPVEVPPDTLAWDGRAEWRSRRTHPPLPERAPDPQLTLF